MTSLEPIVDPKGAYSPNETAKLLGVHRNTLRSYTERGYINCEFRAYSYRKVYTGAEITRFWRARV